MTLFQMGFLTSLSWGGDRSVSLVFDPPPHGGGVLRIAHFFRCHLHGDRNQAGLFANVESCTTQVDGGGYVSSDPI